MLNEIRAQGLDYDARTDTARLRAPGAQGGGKLALLDARGFLVGVDLRDDAGRGSVVMLGPHEAVTTTRPLDLHLDSGAIVIAKARTTIRGADPNPYA